MAHNFTVLARFRREPRPAADRFFCNLEKQQLNITDTAPNGGQSIATLRHALECGHLHSHFSADILLLQKCSKTFRARPVVESILENPPREGQTPEHVWTQFSGHFANLLMFTAIW